MRAARKALSLLAILASVGIIAEPAVAEDRTDRLNQQQHDATAPQPGSRNAGNWERRRGPVAQRAAGEGGISCVPYARQVTGMAVSGNGWQWWDNAAGVYSRGRRPEPGAVLTFRASGGMSSGHVAVVDRLVGARHVLIDHANWAGPGIRRGTVMHDVSVVDVSPDNDWSAVRVQIGHDPKTFGRTYPTYGFIYNRPEPNPANAGSPVRRPASFEQLAEYPNGAVAGSVRGRRQDR